MTCSARVSRSAWVIRTHPSLPHTYSGSVPSIGDAERSLTQPAAPDERQQVLGPTGTGGLALGCAQQPLHSKPVGPADQRMPLPGRSTPESEDGIPAGTRTGYARAGDPPPRSPLPPAGPGCADRLIPIRPLDQGPALLTRHPDMIRVLLLQRPGTTRPVQTDPQVLPVPNDPVYPVQHHLRSPYSEEYL